MSLRTLMSTIWFELCLWYYGLLKLLLNRKKLKTNTEGLFLTSGISYQRKILYFTKISNGNFWRMLHHWKGSKVDSCTDTVILVFFNIRKHKVLKYIWRYVQGFKVKHIKLYHKWLPILLSQRYDLGNLLDIWSPDSEMSQLTARRLNWQETLTRKCWTWSNSSNTRQMTLPGFQVRGVRSRLTSKTHQLCNSKY